jgi:hypothetical protein
MRCHPECSRSSGGAKDLLLFFDGAGYICVGNNLMPNEAASEEADVHAQIAHEVKKWRRATLLLGIGLLISSIAWVPFWEGNSLHHLWKTFGRVFAVLTMAFFFPCLYAGVTTLNLLWYGASLRKIDREFAETKHNHRQK